MDSVDLSFTAEALERTVAAALRRQTGARGLRAILESTLLDVMYEVPSRSDVRRVVVHAEAVTGHARPLLLDEREQVVAWGDEALKKAA
jgi:ATP-dependent Clp protease ATP-binding subunit ClpX